MSKLITRRNFLAATTIGAATLLAPSSIAFASEKPNISIQDISSEVEKYLPEVPLSDNEEINIMNRAALEKWAETVEKALLEGSEIHSPGVFEATTPQLNHISPVCGKHIINGFYLYYTATYDGYADSNLIGSVYGARSFDQDSRADAVDIVYPSWTIVDAGRTLGVSYTTMLTINNASVYIVTAYAEFYANGACWVLWANRS